MYGSIGHLLAKNSFRKVTFIFLLALFSAGCTSLAKVIIGKRGMAIPQIVAHLEPILTENKVLLLGKIVIQNPTESILELDKIYLTIKDEKNTVLGEDVLAWGKSSVMSNNELEAPVNINLGLAALNKKSIAIFLQTSFTYKKFDLCIPIVSKIAVLHLDALKESITRPLYVNICTKFRTNLLGAASVEYVFDITNPIPVDLLFEEGKIRIYTINGKDIVKAELSQILFKASQNNQIKGTIQLGNIFGGLIGSEFSKRSPLQFQLSGKLKIPDTDISMPFKIQFTQEIAISLSR